MDDEWLIPGWSSALRLRMVGTLRPHGTPDELLDIGTTLALVNLQGPVALWEEFEAGNSPEARTARAAAGCPHPGSRPLDSNAPRTEHS
ncbi:hypothetical protein AB0C81_18190 [Streptomyces roseoverticillatus]|uniref:hypothetical protein n=1 Tax=Streptomyces roseoverticillatus TaxID=66429 RepID=UPI0033ED5E43